MKVVQLLPHRVSIRFECNLYVFCVVFRVTDPTLHNVLFKERLLRYCYNMVLVPIIDYDKERLNANITIRRNQDIISVGFT